MIETALHTTSSAAATAGPFAWACPSCRAPLRLETEGAGCPACGTTFARREGIWYFLPDGRAAVHAPFLERYEAVRRHEGWGRADDVYYRALPDVPSDDPHRGIWQVRRRTFRAFVRRVLMPLETRAGGPLRVVDLGAGNGWLAYRLACRGHHVAAVDLQTDARDGLGACRHYDALFWPVRAEFDRLPFGDAQFDLAVFNGSIHYAVDYAVTLGEALRVLRPAGAVVLLDSPCYPDAESGRRMVRERETRFRTTLGLAPASLDHEHFLTGTRLEDVAARLGLVWERYAPFYGWRWLLRPWWARLRGRRAPAAFGLFVGRRDTPRPARRRPLYRRLAQPLWRRWLGWRFRLFHRHRYDRLVVERVAGRALVVLPQVFNPALFRTGAFLAEALEAQRIPPGSTVLDMGTGSGVGAVFAALRGARVDAVDVNPHAVRCARINALLHEVADRVAVVEGDLFAPVEGRRYDVVLFNPPYFRGTPGDALDHAWRSNDVAERFAAGLGDHLAPGGCALVVLSSDGDAAGFLGAFRANGFRTEVVAERDLINEVLTLYRVAR